MRFIEELKEGERIVEHYLCKKKQSLKTRAGKTYYSILLQDKTGLITAKVWDLNNNIQNFEENNFVKIDAMVISYQNDLQLNITKIRKSEDGEFDKNDFIPKTEKNLTELHEKLIFYINSIQNKYIKQLLEMIFVEDSVISSEFSNHSAAKTMHHSYMGGLLEHTISVIEICDFMSDRYKGVNRDVLIASAMLHDMGKIFELSNFPDNDYTDEGQLLGHLIISIEVVGEKVYQIENFPKVLERAIKHCLISHHGEYEYGSPKRPKTIEAFILHCADNMDAKVKIFEEIIEKDTTRGDWVGFHRMLDRNIRKSNYEE